MLYYRQAPQPQLADELRCLRTALQVGITALMDAPTADLAGISLELASTAEQLHMLARAATDRELDITG